MRTAADHYHGFLATPATHTHPAGASRLTGMNVADTVAGFGAHDHTGLLGTEFGAHTTLGYLGEAGGTRPHTDGTHGAKLALLGNYMAASFVTPFDGRGGTLFTEGSLTANQLMPVTTPHTG